jgi:GTP cyclohydrolase II
MRAMDMKSALLALGKNISEAVIPTSEGQYRMVVFEEAQTGLEHFAMIMGETGGDVPALTRIHSECITGDLFGSLRCDCGEQLAAARKRIAEHGTGVIIYLRQEGRGIGLANKLRAYALQDRGYDTVDANLLLGFPVDQRDFDVAASMLLQLGIDSVRLMTNNPHKVEALESVGIRVVERIPLRTQIRPENRRYLSAKAEKLGHCLDGFRDAPLEEASSDRVGVFLRGKEPGRAKSRQRNC